MGNRLLAVLLLSASCWAQYTVARTDTNVTQLPNPMPTWGATGTGKKWCNPAYNNICITRLTDSNTFPNKASAQTVEDGKESIISLNEQFVLVKTTNGTFRVISYNKGTSIVAPTNSQFDYAVVFSKVNATILGLDGTKIVQITTTNGWATSTIKVVYDFASCLPSTFKKTWSSSWSVPIDNVTYLAAFSDRGGQGTGEYVAAYRVGFGCSLINTLTGAVTNWAGKPLGTIDDGSKPLADRFTIHDVGNGQNPNYASVGASLHDGTSPGCKAGSCETNSPYIWELGTSHLRPCGPYKCEGHGATGYWMLADGKGYTSHYLSGPSAPITNLMPAMPTGAGDIAGSWNNAKKSPGPADTVPAFGVTSIVTTVPILNFTAPYQDEIWAAMGGKVWRFGQTLNSGISPYYIIQNAHMSVAASGDGVVFASDMGANGALGFESDGITSRGDVFWMDTK